MQLITFNTQRLVGHTIHRMTDSQHPSMRRLLEAAVAARVIDDPDAHGSIAALARKLNKSDQVLRNWSARGVSNEGALEAAGILHSDANWVLNGIKPPDQRIFPPSIIAGAVSVAQFSVQEPRSKYLDDVVITQYETGGKMGHGLVLRDQPGVIENWKVSIEWARANIPPCTGYSNLRIVTGYGDSNKGLYNSGDPLIVDVGITAVDRDAVFFFRVGDEGYIKQLQRIPSSDGLRIKVKSFNERYDPWWIEPSMDFEVFGLVLKVWQGQNL
jgi:hypothetical protein